MCVGSLSLLIECRETGATVYCPNPRRRKGQTVCRCLGEGSTFSSIILRISSAGDWSRFSGAVDWLFTKYTVRKKRPVIRIILNSVLVNFIDLASRSEYINFLFEYQCWKGKLKHSTNNTSDPLWDSSPQPNSQMSVHRLLWQEHLVNLGPAKIIFWNLITNI